MAARRSCVVKEAVTAKRMKRTNGGSEIGKPHHRPNQMRKAS